MSQKQLFQSKLSSLHESADKACIRVVIHHSKWMRNDAPTTKEGRQKELQKLDKQLLLEDCENSLRNLELRFKELAELAQLDELWMPADSLWDARRTLNFFTDKKFEEITDDFAASYYTEKK